MKAGTRYSALTVAVVAMLLGGVGSAGATSVKPRQKMDFTFTSTRSGTPTGAQLNPTWLGAHPGEKPHSITDDVFTFAQGSRLDFSVPKVCAATDAELTKQGPSACPKASRVAAGEIDLDLGKAVWIIPRIVKTHAVVLNGGAGELITVAQPTNVPLGVPIRVVDRATVKGLSIKTENPPTPGFPPPDDFVAVKRDRIKFFKIVKGSGDNRRGFLTTPERCPASGRWMNKGVFHYHDDVTERVSSPSPCEG